MKLILSILSAAFVLAVLAPAAALAEAPYTAGTMGIYVENDAFAGTDRYYTSGVKLSWTSPDIQQISGSAHASMLIPAFELLPAMHDSKYQKNVIYSLGQDIYTPDNTETFTPSPTDRPYAGWLYVSNGVVWKTDRVRNILVMDIGVVGSYSLAQEAQRYVHDVRGFDHPNGWDHQLHNEIGITLAYERVWRLPHIVKRSGLEWELMPHAGATAGNVKDYANVGGEFRLGVNLPDDYGTPSIGPSSVASTPVDGPYGAERSSFPLGFHIFVRADGRAVAHNIFLDGNTFGNSPSVGHNVFVADLSTGFVINWRNTKMAYALVYRTKEFSAQIAPQVFGTVSLNWTF